MSSSRQYGSGFNTALNAISGKSASDGTFATIISQGLAASEGTVVADVQSGTAYISGNDGFFSDLKFLCTIPDSYVPTGATNISVRIAGKITISAPAGTPQASFFVGTNLALSSVDFGTFTISSGTEFVSAARTTDHLGVALTASTLVSELWGIHITQGVGAVLLINEFALYVTYTNPAGTNGALEDSQIPGQTARLNVLRLGASRLGAAIDSPNLQDGANGLYDYSRSTPQAGPPGAAQNSWTEVIDPEDV